jgi:nitroimidazol reductase NimA-like FMN-containing flavoprotein (pyridoxamine 5'-phosphate oxidase superfamily)
VLDAGYVAHVAFVENNQPFCIPMLYARIGGAVYIHGSSASRAIRILSSGVPSCVTVTILDGLLLARSAFEHSANYRSATVFGSFRRITEDSEHMAAFAAFTNKLIPGRWAEVREPSRQELKASQILALPIAEASLKMRTGPPTDDDTPDAERDVWAGVLPLNTFMVLPRRRRVSGLEFHLRRVRGALSKAMQVPAPRSLTKRVEGLSDGFNLNHKGTQS